MRNRLVVNFGYGDLIRFHLQTLLPNLQPACLIGYSLAGRLSLRLLACLPAVRLGGLWQAG